MPFIIRMRLVDGELIRLVKKLAVKSDVILENFKPGSKLTILEPIK